MTDKHYVAPEAPDSEAPRESWKEIAAHLKRDVSTVKRWEKAEGLPVHRHVHQARSSVYAYPSELDAWLASRRPGLEAAAALAAGWRRPAPLLAVTAVLLLALLSVAGGPIVSSAEAGQESVNKMVARQVWTGPGVDILGGVSADGRYLSFVDWETGDLAIRDLTTGENRRLTNKGSWFQSVEFALFSTVSPDAQQIAYSWFNKDFSFDLRIIGLDGSPPRVVYRNQEIDYLQPAAWSPDGKQILVTFFRQDKTNQIVLVSVADGSARVLKTLDWRWPAKMSFSPDGRYIVYDFPEQQDSPERDIFLLASDGSREIPLVQHPANDLFPTWAPDVNRVVFTSDRTGTLGVWLIAVVDGKPAGSPALVKPDLGRSLPLGLARDGSYYYGLQTGMQDVYVATLDPATGQILKPPISVSQRFVGSNTAPDWSPDGRYLAYIRVQPGPVPESVGPKFVVIRALETGEERELAPKLNDFARLRWSPDGRFLLVSGRDGKGRQGLFLIEVSSGEVKPAVQSQPGTYIYYAVWSSAGKSVFYWLIDSTTKAERLIRHELETHREKELFRRVLGSSSRNLALSPDGQQLAFFDDDRVTGTNSLKVVSTSGGQPREVVRWPKPEVTSPGSGLTWTLDGRYLLFTRPKQDPKQGEQINELWRVSAEGGEPERLGLAMEQLSFLRFHPDGRQILFRSGTFSSEIWVLENFLPALKAAK